MTTLNERPELAGTIISCIIEMEEYLLTESKRTKVPDMWQLSFSQLWELHDKLVAIMKGII